MADPREGPRGARASPLFLDQTEGRRAEKHFFGGRGGGGGGGGGARAAPYFFSQPFALPA